MSAPREVTILKLSIRRAIKLTFKGTKKPWHVKFSAELFPDLAPVQHVETQADLEVLSRRMAEHLVATRGKA